MSKKLYHDAVRKQELKTRIGNKHLKRLPKKTNCRIGKIEFTIDEYNSMILDAVKICFYHGVNKVKIDKVTGTKTVINYMQFIPDYIKRQVNTTMLDVRNVNKEKSILDIPFLREVIGACYVKVHEVLLKVSDKNKVKSLKSYYNNEYLKKCKKHHFVNYFKFVCSKEIYRSYKEFNFNDRLQYLEEMQDATDIIDMYNVIDEVELELQLNEYFTNGKHRKAIEYLMNGYPMDWITKKLKMNKRSLVDIKKTLATIFDNNKIINTNFSMTSTKYPCDNYPMVDPVKDARIYSNFIDPNINRLDNVDKDNNTKVDKSLMVYELSKIQKEYNYFYSSLEYAKEHNLIVK